MADGGRPSMREDWSHLDLAWLAYALLTGQVKSMSALLSLIDARPAVSLHGVRPVRPTYRRRTMRR